MGSTDMAIGDLRVSDHGDGRDLYCLDTGLYGTPNNGAIYVFDTERPAVIGRLVSESSLAAALGHPAGTVPVEMIV